MRRGTRRSLTYHTACKLRAEEILVWYATVSAIRGARLAASKKRVFLPEPRVKTEYL